MKKGWKLLILVSCIVTLFMFFSAISCSVGPIGSTYTITVNNSARASYVDLYINGVFRSTIWAFATNTFPGINSGDRVTIANNIGHWMQFDGGNYYYDVYFNVTFIIPSGGIWVTAERGE